jgi:hypothetical protein
MARRGVFGRTAMALTAVMAMATGIALSPLPPAGASLPALRIGAVPAVARGDTRLGPLAGSTRLQVDVELLPRNPAGLTGFATAVSTPGNGLYRHYLGHGELASRFGPTAAAVAGVERWLAAEGLHVGRISSNHLTICVSADASVLAAAFSTTFVLYRAPGGGSGFVDTRAPLLPGSIARFVGAVIGLDTLSVPQRVGFATGSHSGRAGPGPVVVTGGPQPCAAALSAAGADGAFTADQLAAAYGFSGLYGEGDEGAGVTVGLFELEPYLASDVAAYQSCYGTGASVTNTEVDGGSGTGPGDGEAALDIEDVLGLAPRAAIDVYEGPDSDAGLVDVYSSIVSQDSAQVVSTSWGVCEPDSDSSVVSSEESLFEEAAAQGQSVLAAAGDLGSEGCLGSDALAVDDPASQSYVTAVGGTEVDALGMPPTEQAWNAGGNGAGGGGISALHAMPSYQSGAPAWLDVVGTRSAGAPCGAASGSYCREVPDVSADADPDSGYLVYYDGAWDEMGGTSAAAPLWAALLALVDASSPCAGKTIGFANPALYAAAAASYEADFDDVTFGDNDRTGTNDGLYPAIFGYDMATGLGTPKGTSLAAALCTAGPPADVVTAESPGAEVSQEGSRQSLQLTGTDSADLRLAWSASDVPPGLSISSSGEITGTPETVGVFSVTVTDTDRAGASGSTAFLWTVIPRDANQVAVTDPGPQYSVAGASVDLQIAAADSAGLGLVLSSSSLPYRLSMSPSGDITGMPENPGQYWVTVTAADSTGAIGSTGFTWTVSPSGGDQDIVTVASPGKQESTVNQAVSLQIQASHSASGQALQYYATGLPAGLSIDPSTGLVAGTATSAGSWAVEVIASDMTGAFGNTSFVWVLSPAPSKDTLALSAPTVVYGDEQAERFSVDVSSRTGASPTGEVVVRSGTTTLCSVRLSAGKGSCRPAPRSLPAGSYRIVAHYDGSHGFKSSVSVAHPLSVSKAATASSLSLSTGRVKAGDEQSARFDASVSPREVVDVRA